MYNIMQSHIFQSVSHEDESPLFEFFKINFAIPGFIYFRNDYLCKVLRYFFSEKFHGFYKFQL